MKYKKSITTGFAFLAIAFIILIFGVCCSLNGIFYSHYDYFIIASAVFAYIGFIIVFRYSKNDINEKPEVIDGVK